MTYATLKPIDSKPRSRKPAPEKNENIQGIGNWELSMGNWELVEWSGRVYEIIGLRRLLRVKTTLQVLLKPLATSETPVGKENPHQCLRCQINSQPH